MSSQTRVTLCHLVAHSPILAGLLAVLGCLAAGIAYAAEETSRPNIVLIMADDMGYSDIGCYGGEVETPNLDRLAGQGLRFTQFYNTGRCCPTRASLLTGLYPHQAGVGHMMNDWGRPGYRGDLNEQCVTIAEALGAAGYQTMMAGKWHVTRHVGHWSRDEQLTSKHNWPLQRGFEKFYGIIHGAASFYDPISLTRGNEPVEPDGDSYYFTDAISDHAAKYIDAAAREKPLFLYVAYTAPHWPLHAPAEVIGKYKARYQKGWDAIREERRERMIEQGLIGSDWELTPRDPSVPSWEDAPHKDWEAHRMAVYAAMIDVLDQGVGRIVEALERTGCKENTLILFLADNGGCAEVIGPRWGGLHIPRRTRDGRAVKIGNDPKVLPGNDDDYQSYGVGWANASNTPFRLYKHWVHEGGIATPLIVHWPGAMEAKGNIMHEPGHLIDIMPTCLDAAGADYPASRQGRRTTPLPGESLLPIFRGRAADPNRVIYWEHEGNRAVRQGKWKLVARHRGSWELYDMDADRTEMHNLAADHPQRVREMAALHENWAKRSNVVAWDEAQPR